MYRITLRACLAVALALILTSGAAVPAWAASPQAKDTSLHACLLDWLTDRLGFFAGTAVRDQSGSTVPAQKPAADSGVQTSVDDGGDLSQDSLDPEGEAYPGRDPNG